MIQLLAAGAVALILFTTGFKLGSEHEVAAQARANKQVEDAVDAANIAAAKAIAELKPRYTTIKQELQREIRTNTHYIDCRNTADGLRIINEALSATRPAGGLKLPSADPTR